MVNVIASPSRRSPSFCLPMATPLRHVPLDEMSMIFAQYWPSSLVPEGRTVQCEPLMCGRSTCSR